MKQICTCCGEEYQTDGGLQEAMDLFERVHGRKANGAEELEGWLDTDKAAQQIKLALLQ